MRHSSEEKSFRHVLTADQHGLLGVPVFACAKGADAALPIIEHRHKDKYECVLLKDGVRTLSCGGVPYTVYPENAFFVHPDEPHSADVPGKGAGEMLFFQINAQGSLLSLTEEEQGFVRMKLSECRTRLFCVPESVYAMFRESFRLLAKGGMSAALRGRAIFICALMSLLESPAAAAVLSPEIDRAKRHIMAHLREPIDPDELRESSGLSRTAFAERFEAQIGFAPKEYIRRLKIEAAARELAEGTRTIADVAFEYRFSSLTYFKTLFKRYIGCSPKQYREKARKRAVR